MPLARAMVHTLTPDRHAIEFSVSPQCTVYQYPHDGDGGGGGGGPGGHGIHNDCPA